MLIHSDTLWLSKADFSSTNEFNSENWKNMKNIIMQSLMFFTLGQNISID